MPKSQTLWKSHKWLDVGDNYWNTNAVELKIENINISNLRSCCLEFFCFFSWWLASKYLRDLQTFIFDWFFKLIAEVQLREYWYSLVEVLIVVVEVVINGISTGRISKSPILTTKKKLISWWTAVQLHPATLLHTKTDKVIWNSNSNPLPNCGWTVWLTKVQKWKYLWKVFLDSWRVILQVALYFLGREQGSLNITRFYLSL